MEELVKKFVDAIECVGGVVRNNKGLHEPRGDREWIDLGELYIECCAALGKQPEIAYDDDGEEYKD